MMQLVGLLAILLFLLALGWMLEHFGFDKTAKKQCRHFEYAPDVPRTRKALGPAPVNDEVRMAEWTRRRARMAGLEALVKVSAIIDAASRSVDADHQAEWLPREKTVAMLLGSNGLRNDKKGIKAKAYLERMRLELIREPRLVYQDGAWIYSDVPDASLPTLLAEVQEAVWELSEEDMYLLFSDNNINNPYG